MRPADVDVLDLICVGSGDVFIATSSCIENRETTVVTAEKRQVKAGSMTASIN